VNYKSEDSTKKPEQRIGTVAGAFTRHFFHKYRHLPDDADFRDELAPYLELEICSAVLAVLQRHGTFVEALDVVQRIEALHKVIEVREKRP